MKEKNPFKINFAFLSGSIIVFMLLMMPPFLQAFTIFNPQGEIELRAELKAQEINPWIDVPIVELNNLTLRQVFEDSNLVTNYDFSDNVINWIAFDSILSIVNGRLRVTLNTGNYRYAYQDFQVTASDKIYLHSEGFFGSVPWKVSMYDSLGIRISNSLTQILDGFYNDIVTISTTGTFQLRLFADNRLDGGYSEFDNIMLINMSEIGIDNLTKEKMDYYYLRYQRYKDSTINDYTTVMNNTLELAPFINPLELVSKSIEFYTEIVVDTYTTISNVWNSASEWLSLTIDISPVQAMEIYDKWWFKPFQWLIGD